LYVSEISVNRFFEASGATATKTRNERLAKVTLKGVEDKVLEWYFVSVGETTDEPAPPGEPVDDAQAGIVDALVPFHLGTTKIELMLFRRSGEVEEEVTVATYRIGKSAPKVRNIKLPDLSLLVAKLKESASGAQPLSSTDAIPLKTTWEASNSDSDITTYKSMQHQCRTVQVRLFPGHCKDESGGAISAEASSSTLVTPSTFSKSYILVEAHDPEIIPVIGNTLSTFIPLAAN
jgi:hypothetical protein